MTINYDKIYECAASARKNAYAPYSEFAVGAAVLLRDGRVITGANVENASYPLSLCAERAAPANPTLSRSASLAQRRSRSHRAGPADR